MSRIDSLGDASSLSKGAKTRAKLRRVAAAEFARLGFHNTKVSDIVSRAGLTQPVFYNYFNSKEAAYEELIGEFRERMERLIHTLLIEPEIPADQVLDRASQNFIKFLDFLAEDSDLTEIGFFQPPGCAATRASMTSWVTENIAKEQQSGLFRSDISPRQIAQCFVGMIDQMAREPADEQNRKELARGCALLFCEGLSRHA